MIKYGFLNLKLCVHSKGCALSLNVYGNPNEVQLDYNTFNFQLKNLDLNFN